MSFSDLDSFPDLRKALFEEYKKKKLSGHESLADQYNVSLQDFEEMEKISRYISAKRLRK